MFLIIFLLGGLVVAGLIGMVIYAVATGETPTPQRWVTGLSRRFRRRRLGGQVVGFSETSSSPIETEVAGATKDSPATTFRM